MSGPPQASTSSTAKAVPVTYCEPGRQFAQPRRHPDRQPERRQDQVAFGGIVQPARDPRQHAKIPPAASRNTHRPPTSRRRCLHHHAAGQCGNPQVIEQSDDKLASGKEGAVCQPCVGPGCRHGSGRGWLCGVPHRLMGKQDLGPFANVDVLQFQGGEGIERGGRCAAGQQESGRRLGGQPARDGDERQTREQRGQRQGSSAAGHAVARTAAEKRRTAVRAARRRWPRRSRRLPGASSKPGR